MKEECDGQPIPLRRRGDILLQAIHEATLAELAEVGFGRLTMEGIAERAHTGKMSLYRRWASLQDLVLDALSNALSQHTTIVPDTGSLREDLIALFKNVREVMKSPVGPAMNAIIGEQHRHPDLVSIVRERIIEPRSQILQVLERGVARGEICPDMITSHVCRAGKEMIIMQYLMHGVTPDDAEIAAIVDRIVLPALGIRPLS